MRSLIHERGYDRKQQETLRSATKEEQDEWNAAKAELLAKDAQMDHAINKVKLSYKGAIVDQKLNQLRE